MGDDRKSYITVKNYSLEPTPGGLIATWDEVLVEAKEIADRLREAEDPQAAKMEILQEIRDRQPGVGTLVMLQLITCLFCYGIKQGVSSLLDSDESNLPIHIERCEKGIRDAQLDKEYKRVQQGKISYQEYQSLRDSVLNEIKERIEQLQSMEGPTEKGED